MLSRKVYMLIIVMCIVISASACTKKEEALPRVEITTPQTEQSGNIIISYILFDKESKPASILVQYSLNGGVKYSTASEAAGGDGKSNLQTALRGIAHSFLWDSRKDIGDTNHNDIKIAITPSVGEGDNKLDGKKAYSLIFTVKNFQFSSWIENVRVDDGAVDTSAETPAVCADSTGIYIAWSDNRDGDYDIFYSFSADKGATWSDAVKVNDDSSGANQKTPSIAADSAGCIYLVWEDKRNGKKEIYLATGFDPGTGFSFGINSRIDDSTADSFAPAIAVSGTFVYITWTDSRDDTGDIYLRRSIDATTTWADVIKINDDSAAVKQETPALYADGSGNIFVVWSDTRNGNSDIYFALGTDIEGILTFSDNLRIDDADEDTAATLPVICGTGTNLYIFWVDARNDDGDIFFGRSNDSGTTWNDCKKVNLRSGTFLQTTPTAAAYGTEIYVIWQDNRDGDANIYLTKGSNLGGTFAIEYRIDDDITTAEQSFPALTVYNELRFVAFHDKRSGDADIYFTTRR
ncbi:MAG: sialidase family protein [Planctomycetota bacterium]